MCFLTSVAIWQAVELEAKLATVEDGCDQKVLGNHGKSKLGHFIGVSTDPQNCCWKDGLQATRNQYHPFSIKPSILRADNFDQKPDGLGGTIVVIVVH